MPDAIHVLLSGCSRTRRAWLLRSIESQVAHLTWRPLPEVEADLARRLALLASHLELRRTRPRGVSGRLAVANLVCAGADLEIVTRAAIGPEALATLERRWRHRIRRDAVSARRELLGATLPPLLWGDLLRAAESGAAELPEAPPSPATHAPPPTSPRPRHDASRARREPPGARAKARGERTVPAAPSPSPRAEPSLEACCDDVAQRFLSLAGAERAAIAWRSRLLLATLVPAGRDACVEALRRTVAWLGWEAGGPTDAEARPTPREQTHLPLAVAAAHALETLSRRPADLERETGQWRDRRAAGEPAARWVSELRRAPLPLLLRQMLLAEAEAGVADDASPPRRADDRLRA